ncbi:MAG: hypothetical protein L3J47_12390 [Sulfurovum sp.]|nr:hypothetical protein [Sulfurovum sp.]
MRSIVKHMTLLGTVAWGLSGCVGSAPGTVPSGYGSDSGKDFIYNGHNFGPERDAEYRAGVEDGCKTSNGDYTKNHTAYQTNESYHVGWDHGRLHCKGDSE